MTSDILSVKVACKIEEIRLQKGLTQEELASDIGISRASLVNMEAGRQAISLVRLFAFADSLGIEAKELLPDNKWYQKYKGKKLRKEVRLVIDE
jgi:transcriptional regulator with XRE-family HTH domain